MSSLTPKQLQVLALVDHYHEALGEAAPAAFVARKLGITHQRVQEYFKTLSDLGHLRGAGSPAIPTGPMPGHTPPLLISQLPTAGEVGHAVDVKPGRAGQPAAEPHVVEMPPLALMAEIRAENVDLEARTVEVVFSTGAPVQRYDWMRDQVYFETLSLEPGHVRLKRLNNSAPVLDSHSSYRVGSVLGVVVPQSAEVDGKKGTATLRFSKRPEVNSVWLDVRDAILRNVSVGYRVWKYERVVTEDGKPETRHAIDWEPYEISAVPMGADDGAKMRGEKAAETNQCQIVTRGATAKENKVENDNPSETIAETDQLTPTPAATRTTETTEHDAGVALERERVEGIRNACLAARVSRSFEDRLIKSGMSLVKAQGEVFDELRKRGADGQGPGLIPANGGAGRAEVAVGEDPLVHVRAGIENALLHRVAPALFKLEDVGRKYRGMSMLDVGRAYLSARGIRTTNLSKMELAGLALGLVGRGGMHTTSDFALLLADVASKTLRAAYAEAPQTFASITRRVTLTDFKPSNRLQLGDAPALLEVKEHGEFTRGTVTEGKEVLQLKTFGRVFAITRQALVNDDTDAFSRVATMFGRSARTLESDLAWAQITSNPVMGDGVALFHATHGNLDAAASVISVASLGKGRAAMRVQKGIDGATMLNVNPKFLATPAALETLAATFLVQITPALVGSVNPFAGLLSPIVEPRLDTASATAWYLFAGDGFDVIEMATLEGEAGPMVESRIGFDIDGLEIKARHDVAAKVIDWRGVWKNPGV